jgi:hypothetical protein
MSECPLCRENNHCAIEAGEEPETCWCMSVAIPPQLLEADSTNKEVCICQKCIEKYKKGRLFMK